MPSIVGIEYSSAVVGFARTITPKDIPFVYTGGGSSSPEVRYCAVVVSCNPTDQATVVFGIKKEDRKQVETGIFDLSTADVLTKVPVGEREKINLENPQGSVVATFQIKHIRQSNPSEIKPHA